MPKRASHEIAAPRCRYHERLVEEGVVAVVESPDGSVNVSNADPAISISRMLAWQVAMKLHAGLVRTKRPVTRHPEESFARITGDFLRESVSILAHQRFPVADFQPCDSGDALPHTVFRNTDMAMVWTAPPDVIRQFRPAPVGHGSAPARRFAVTAECLPTRLACLALGAPGLECVYHYAFLELFFAVEDYARKGREDLQELLMALMVAGRIKDISALPEDLIA